MRDIEYYIKAKYSSKLRLEAAAESIANARINSHKRKLSFNLHAPKYEDVAKLVSNVIEQYAGGEYNDDAFSCAGLLVDNKHLIEKTLIRLDDSEKTIRSKRLPCLADGEYMGYMRVLAIADSMVRCSFSMIDEASIFKFTDIVQEIAPLSLHEVSALLDMIRYSLIETIGSISRWCFERMELSIACEALIERLLSNSSKAEKTLMRISKPDVAECLYMKLIEREEYSFIELFGKRLVEAKIDIEHELKKSAYVREILINTISSIRAVDAIDEGKLIMRISTINRIYSTDEIYSRMDDSSKAYYMRCTESIAKQLKLNEAIVAKRAIGLAHERTDKHIASHVGYYLIGNGRDTLFSALRPEKRIRNASITLALCMFMAMQYAFALILIALGLIEGLLSAVLTISAAIYIGYFIAVKVSCLLVKPKCIPRLSLEAGIGLENRTLLVIPVLLFDEKSVDESIRRIEQHYIASKLDNCFFAVLGDFKDSDTLDCPGEAEMLSYAKSAIAKLNSSYRSDEPIFYFLHRHRTYNQYDNRYMGYERKRGAIEELVKLVSNGDAGSFCMQAPTSLPGNIRYIATLDGDTVLPHGALKRMIGGMAHPLNKPVYDSDGRVVQGYGIISPRMESRAKGKDATRFAGIVAYNGGLNSYDSVVSDLAQDFFGEGNFGGKGIFSVEAYEKSLSDYITENTVLSHDLLEGCRLRCGYMSDVILYDSEPKTFFAWWKRRHRWLRGDWQLLSFVFSKKKQGLSMLHKWKIFDNLFRGLFSINILMGFIFSLIFCQTYATLIYIVAIMFDFVWELLRILFSLRDKRMDPRGSANECLHAQKMPLLSIATLPYDAYMCIDAAIRSLYRLLISNKKLLEWQTAAESDGKQESLTRSYNRMAIDPLAGLLMIALGMFSSASAFCVPLGALWIASPWFVYRLDLPLKQKLLSASQADELKKLASLIFDYFRDTCIAENNFLPPDNVQIAPKKPAATITSPTNIGMGMMAVVSAYDLKLIDENELHTKLHLMLSSIERMDKWYGHLYNWYNVRTLEPIGNKFVSTVDSGNLLASLMSVKSAMDEHSGERFSDIKERCTTLINAMDFSHLYDAQRSLFHIGYDVSAGKLTPSYYDLLASEARITVFACVATGKISSKAWFKLGRVLTDAYGTRMLASWSGTAFEYQMAGIFMNTYKGTLLRVSCEGVVRAQREFAEKDRPWGVSESGYFAFDKELYYQYRAFGVPQLGICVDERSRHMVVPYATLLSLEYNPFLAYQNIEALIKIGMLGKYGLYEAVDYSSGQKNIVKSFMAHHEGMGICAINNAVNDGILKKRFMSIPGVSAAEILLEEKRPRKSLVVRRLSEALKESAVKRKMDIRSYVVNDGEISRSQTLTNGRYSAFFTSDGNSFIKCDDVMLGTWRPWHDSMPYGLQVLIKYDDKIISPTYAVAGYNNNSVEFSSAKAVFACSSDEIEVKREICLPPEGVLERITVINKSNCAKKVDVSAFMEVCMATQNDAVAHPAFVRTSIDAMLSGNGQDILLFRRRPTKKREEKWLFFKLSGDVEYCSDRLTMPGRNTSYKAALSQKLPPRDCITAPIEPGIYAHTLVTVQPHSRVTLSIAMGLSKNEMEAMRLVEELSSHAERSFELAESYISGAMALHGLINPGTELFQQLLHRLMIGDVNTEAQTPFEFGIRNLWRYGISGDSPILLIKLNSVSELKLLKTILKFSRYLECYGFLADIIVLSDTGNDYRDELRDSTTELISAYRSNLVRLISVKSMRKEDVSLLICCSSLYVDLSIGIRKQAKSPRILPYKNITLPSSLGRAPSPLRFDNSFGGFDTVKNEYVIYNRNTPLPWINVLAGETMGCIITENGGGYSFTRNSRELKLTPWSNDVIYDKHGEMIAVDDGVMQYDLLYDAANLVCHGFGYSTFEGKVNDVSINATVFIDKTEPVKFTRIALTNTGLSNKTLSIKYSVSPVIGSCRHDEAISYGCDTNCLLIKNARTAECVDKAMYIAAIGENIMVSGQELHISVPLGATETSIVTLCLGFDTNEKLQQVLSQTQSDIDRRLAIVRDFWRKRVSSVQVRTCDEAFDIMMNGWLMYQTIACRIMARTGFYQCGGAFGFRDQLQDMLALLQSEPDTVRSHILLCASRQFMEGDVLHWWHEGMAGIRTHFADDRLFLPYAVIRYIETTADVSILQENIPYLCDMPYDYAEYQLSDIKEPLLMHCIRAIDASLTLGKHDIPLMQGGDWNDGMEGVGQNGGESVWLALMLIVILDRFASYCDENTKERYLQMQKRLRLACEQYAWDGEWYRRAFMENGVILGSTSSKSCKIDGLTQSWAVFADMAHKETAMKSLETLLFDEENGIIHLLTPAFKPEDTNVGYISAYIEGVRENGGQYTHAAIWAVIAECMLNRSSRAQQMLGMINPINHSGDEMQARRYKTEPYAVAADVYSAGKNVGRGGWTWYTGAASWMYQAGLEYILGIKRRGNELIISPCTTLTPYELVYRFGRSEYHITVKCGDTAEIIHDGTVSGKLILNDDGFRHIVNVTVQ